MVPQEKQAKTAPLVEFMLLNQWAAVSDCDYGGGLLLLLEFLGPSIDDFENSVVDLTWSYISVNYSRMDIRVP